jgi:uncharacterized YigZ family protein
LLEKETYHTLDKPSVEVIYKDRGSKFLAYAFPLHDEEQVKEIVDILKKEHHKARHWCYAWRIGVEKPRYRVNDDGEPNNSAGQPIYGQILSKDLTNILIVVVRYFGGTKLGVGGLVNAYKTAALLALEISDLKIKKIKVYFNLNFDYKSMNNVMRVIKENNLKIIDQSMGLSCSMHVAVSKNEAVKVKSIFENLKNVELTKG